VVELNECVISAYSLLFNDEQNGRLFITFNSELMLLELKPAVKDRVISHDASVVAAFYNRSYNQVNLPT